MPSGAARRPARLPARARVHLRRLPSLLLTLCLALPAARAAAAEDPASAATESFPRGELVENVACGVDPTQTYTLYLPTGYRADREQPALLVFDPRRRGTFAAEIFRDAAERYGWVMLSSNDTISDGPMEPNVKAIKALWPEVHLRYAVDPERIYLAGFSGGAIVAWLLTQETHQIAGILASGGRLPSDVPTERIDAAHFGAAGVHDFNFLEMKRIDALLDERGAPHRLEHYPGRHSWMPAEMATEAAGWMELVAMQRGLAPKDEDFISSSVAADLERARGLEAKGEPLAALRVYRMAARTYRGLADTAEIEQEIAALAKTGEVRRAERDEERWDRYEQKESANVVRVLRTLLDPETVTSQERLAIDLHLRSLQQRAAGGGYAGDAAQRVLEQLFVQTSFYLTREAFADGTYDRARRLLSIAVRIHDDNPAVWYNLACAEARTGHRGDALDALEKAFAAGYRDLEHTRTDADLAAVRDDPRFAKILAAAAAAAAGETAEPGATDANEAAAPEQAAGPEQAASHGEPDRE